MFFLSLVPYALPSQHLPSKSSCTDNPSRHSEGNCRMLLWTDTIRSLQRPRIPVFLYLQLLSSAASMQLYFSCGIWSGRFPFPGKLWLPPGSFLRLLRWDESYRIRLSVSSIRSEPDRQGWSCRIRFSYTVSQCLQSLHIVPEYNRGNSSRYVPAFCTSWSLLRGFLIHWKNRAAHYKPVLPCGSMEVRFRIFLSSYMAHIRRTIRLLLPGRMEYIHL